jgi:large subunit ribosomal protein L24
MTQQKLHIRKGDAVVVISGSQKGKKGEVLKMLREDLRAVVKGVNVVKRHTKASGTNPGGIVEKEMSIHVSNLAHVDPVSGKPTRIGIKIAEDGKKVRVAKKSGKEIK